MTTFSKQFSEKANNLTCKHIFHPDFESCLSYLWFVQRKILIRALKFLCPVFLIPLILKYRNSTIEEWIDSTKTYLKVAFGIVSTGCSSLGMACLLNNITKAMRYYHISLMPALFGVVICANIFPLKFVHLQFLFINNLLVQSIFRNLDYKIFGIVRKSKLFSTILFMLISALIMGLMSLTAGEKHRYWYAHLYHTNNNASQVEVDEKNILKDLVYEQLESTTKIGLLMSSFKILSNSLKLIRVSVFDFMRFFIQNFDYKLLGFFFVYGSFFQIFNHYLNKKYNKTKPHRNSFLAGFLAGIAFYLSPRYSLFTYGFTTVIELNLKGMDQRSKMAKFLKNVPWLKIVLCVSLSTFSHWNVVNPQLVPSFMHELLQVTTDGRLDCAARNYAKYILEI